MYINSTKNFSSKNFNTNEKSGFTLIELSIVLLIISLLVGSFVGAASLISASRAATIVSEFSYYKNAINMFKEKYGQLPGDLTGDIKTNNFSGFADDDCSEAALGDGEWSSITEIDLAFLQLSYDKLIRENISFNACSAPAYREPGVHRPISQAVEAGGYTLQNLVSVSAGSTYYFLKIIRLGGMANSTDTDLSDGKVSVESAKAIDAKIDDANTPFSGKFFVSANCMDSSNSYSYYSDDSEELCVLNWAEQEIGTGAYTP